MPPNHIQVRIAIAIPLLTIAEIITYIALSKAKAIADQVIFICNNKRDIPPLGNAFALINSVLGLYPVFDILLFAFVARLANKGQWREVWIVSPFLIASLICKFTLPFILW